MTPERRQQNQHAGGAFLLLLLGLGTAAGGYWYYKRRKVQEEEEEGENGEAPDAGASNVHFISTSDQFKTLQDGVFASPRIGFVGIEYRGDVRDAVNTVAERYPDLTFAAFPTTLVAQLEELGVSQSDLVVHCAADAAAAVAGAVAAHGKPEWATSYQCADPGEVQTQLESVASQVSTRLKSG